MKKNELKSLAEKYGMEIMRHPITSEAWGLKLETAEDIPELDLLLSAARPAPSRSPKSTACMRP